MIKANELRLGNHVHFLGKTSIITSISKGFECDYIGTKEGGILPISAYNPIPLTEEWLGKFGFIKKQGEINENIDFSLDGFYIQQHLECNDFICLNTDYHISVKYLHQLQNIFYCLIGKELNLKD